jgi:glycosyltransferase involved in cell wall biosynthesis
VAAATSAREHADAAALAVHCERIVAVRVPLARSLWSCLLGLAGRAPLQARFCLAPAMTAQVQRALAAPAAYDVLHVEHLRAALYGLAVSGLPKVYDAVDCMSRLQAHAAAAGPTLVSRLLSRAELGRTRRFERALLSRFDRILTTAASERAALLALAAGDTGAAAARVRVLPNGVDLDYFTPPESRRDPATLLFVGRMAYHANFAAARLLITELLPRLRANRPETRLLLVGEDPPRALRSLAAGCAARVEVTGYVPDLRPYLARATVAVVPLPYAVGIQNKVLEAMAMATPVVATPAAAGGLDATAGEHLLVAEDLDGLAAAVERLLDDPGLARRLGGAGRRYVEAHHDWRAAGRALEEIYRDAVAAHGAARSEAGVGVA